MLGRPANDQDALSYLIYPRVFPDLATHERTYADTSVLPTPLFFFGPEPGVENLVEIELGSNLSEFHSGYRAYNVHTLSELDLSATSNGFNFDTQIIIALHSHGKKIVEIPIPTFYGDEISRVNGVKYAAEIVAATIGLAHALGILVVAEGVEIDTQISRLRDLDCDLAQGYHFSRPLPPDEMTAYLSRAVMRDA